MAAFLAVGGEPVAMSSVAAPPASGGDRGTGWFWIVGVLLTLCGSSMAAGGLLLQKLSHQHASKREQRAEAEESFASCPPPQRSPSYYFMERRWLAGLLCWLMGQVLCWMADGLAARSMLSCFNAWSIVVVLVLAPYVCGEAIDRNSWLAGLVIMGGCVWVVLSGPRAYHSETVESLDVAWSRPALRWIVAGSCLILLTVLARCAWGRRRPTSSEAAVVAAAMAWYCVLCAKCTSMLMVTTVRSSMQLQHWEFYVFLAVMLALAAAVVHVLNVALMSGVAVKTLAAYESLSMTGQIIVCGTFFGEFEAFHAAAYAVFGGAVLCVMAGVALLVQYGNIPEGVVH